MKLKHDLYSYCKLAASLSVLCLGSIAQADELDLASEPLFLQDSVQPNIMIVSDDSGSMNWETLINTGAGYGSSFQTSGSYAGTYGSSSSSLYFDSWSPDSNLEVRQLCPGFNTAAYNPNRTYTPWKGYDENGVEYRDVTTLVGTVGSGPLYDPYEGDESGNVRYIDGHFYFLWNDADGDGEYDTSPSHECPSGSWARSGSSSERRAACRARPTQCVYVGDLSHSIMHGAPGNQQSSITNYGNWYTYYRKRAYIAQRALTELAFESEARMGLGTLHDHNNVGTVIRDMRVPGHKAALLRAIGDIGHSSGTPLRRALYDAGEYFIDGENDLFDNRFTTTSPILSSSEGGACQQNYTIIMSDGYWNSGGPGTSLGNADGDNSSFFDSLPGDGVFGDSDTNTLADVAMYYYETDLSPLEDIVPENALINNGDLNNDMHQHMVTYTVAFGLSGSVNCDPRDAACLSSLPCNTFSPVPTPPAASCSIWPEDVTENTSETIDDMRHAAVNGRGEFLSANNPDELIASLEAAIADIEARNSSSAAVAANSTTLNIGTVVYQAKFNTGDWHGDLTSVSVSIGPTDVRPECSGIAAGGACSPPNWNAGTDDDGINSKDYDSERVIVGFRPSADGIAAPFRWDSLDDGQKGVLSWAAPDGSDDATREEFGRNYVNYLRGDRSSEVEPDGTSATPTAVYRRRDNSVLGDIVNSAPRYVGPPNPNDHDDEDFQTFAEAFDERRPLVYVGANDGMLHAFDAEDGEIVYSYLPQWTYYGIRELGRPDYQHRYFVDGSPLHLDARVNGDWRTVLVAGHGAGGQSIFALDITDPSKFTEDQGDINDVVMWEFDHPDLGYSFSRPDIVRLNTDPGDPEQWAVILGNGYNNTEADGSASTTGFASLFVLSIENATTPLAQLSTGEGSVDTPNGLSVATPVDYDGNGTTDFVYAGDLEGNLWRFDLQDSNPGNWSVTRLFTAISPEGERQPITSRPSVSFHPTEGVTVFFGTGRYIDNSDNTLTDAFTQSFYGIWDDLATTGRPALNRGDTVYLQQRITSQATFDVNGTPGDASDDPELRTTSSNTIDWNTQFGWYIDLINPNVNDHLGERQVSRSVLLNGGRIAFVTIIPDEVACNFGGTSFLMILSTEDGSTIGEPQIDSNADGVISDADLPASGIGADGLLTEPKIIHGDPDVIHAISSSSSGATSSTTLSAGEDPDYEERGRTSWTELVTF